MSSPHLDLARSPHDRLGLRRTDEDWLAETWDRGDSRVLVVAGTRVRPGATGPEWVPAAAAPEGVRVLLGERDGVSHWAVIVTSDHIRDDPESWVPLRGLLSFLDAAEEGVAPLLFHAMGIAEWHWVTRFCPRCGGTLEPRSAGHELHCRDCGKAQFPRTDPAVIMAVVDDETGEVLLGRQSSWPENRYSTLAGFLEPGESFEDAVRREVLEEVGVEVGRVDYFGNQPWPLPASVMIGFVAHATSREIHVDGSEIAHARWFSREDFGRATESGEIAVPQGVSISSSLIQDWYGAPVESSGW